MASVSKRPRTKETGPGQLFFEAELDFWFERAGFGGLGEFRVDNRNVAPMIDNQIEKWKVKYQQRLHVL